MLSTMRLAFIADGRSTHTQKWLAHFAAQGHRVHLITTYPCRATDYPGVTIHPAYVWLRSPDAVDVKNAPGNIRSGGIAEKAASWSRRFGFADVLRPLRARWLVLESWRIASTVRTLLSRAHPDLVHSLRIPIEGYVAALCDRHPLVVSSWGCDFTYWRPMNALHRRMTDRTLRTADAFISDCNRDRQLAFQSGFAKSKPNGVFPASGGVRLDKFNFSRRRGSGSGEDADRSEGHVVLYNRGIGGPFYRFETFARAIPLILRQLPRTRFLILGGAHNAYARRLLDDRGISSQVQLLPYLQESELPRLLQDSDVMVSPSTHDGTPISMLEAMASGCFPIMSDLESIREWIHPGVNGLLFDPHDPGALSQCVVQALENDELRHAAAQINRQVVERRADYGECMTRIEELYANLL